MVSTPLWLRFCGSADIVDTQQQYCDLYLSRRRGTNQGTGHMKKCGNCVLDVDTQEQCLPQRPHRPGTSESLTGHIIEDRIPYHPTSQYTSTTPFLISYQHHYNNALPGSDSSKQDAKQQTLIISISSLFPANSGDGLVSDRPPGFNLPPHGPFFLSYPV